MKLSELMQGHTPTLSYAGIATADDYVLAVDFSGKAASPAEYTVAQEGITEQSGALEATTQDSRYIRSGQQTTKTGTKRSFTVSGDRYVGDEFQDALLDHALKFGSGQAVIKPYVYFCILTGTGEQGQVSIHVEGDVSGAAGENGGISATMIAHGIPQPYTYSE